MKFGWPTKAIDLMAAAGRYQTLYELEQEKTAHLQCELIRARRIGTFIDAEAEILKKAKIIGFSYATDEEIFRQFLGQGDEKDMQIATLTRKLAREHATVVELSGVRAELLRRLKDTLKVRLQIEREVDDFEDLDE